MIQEQLNRLYQPYLSSRTRFVPCGLVNESLYTKSRTRVLWLLKDPNDPEPEAGKIWEQWDLPGQLLFNITQKRWGGRTMWKVIGALTYGMQQNRFPPYRTSYDNEENICDGLRMIGVTNLKKTGGGSTSKNEEIHAAANDDIELWSEEIRIMAPHLVVCGGTYHFINQPLGIIDRLLQVGRWYAIYDFNGHECVLLDMHHPAYRVSGVLHYSFFKDCVLELRTKGLIP